MVGDALVSAAFLAYIGYFNQTYRTMLLGQSLASLRTLPDFDCDETESWKAQLEVNKVAMKSDVSG